VSIMMRRPLAAGATVSRRGDFFRLIVSILPGGLDYKVAIANALNFVYNMLERFMRVCCGYNDSKRRSR